MAVYQLIYTSRAFGYDAASLDGILLSARRLNARDGITGALICRHDVYLQLLEGERGMVQACFDRISRDDRHVNVRLIEGTDVPDRMFGDWSMWHDPAVTWMWSAADVDAGAADRADADEVRGIFRQAGARNGRSGPTGCPVAHP